MKRVIRHASLFSGIGGFELAAEWMGWENIFMVEISGFCQQVLKHHFPQADLYGDIRDFKGKKYYGTVDIISAGFPCQPFSVAGKRRGSTDDRFLWPEALRVIKEVQPGWILLENVGGIFSILEPDTLSEVELQEIELFCADKRQRQSTTIIRIQRRILGTIISEVQSAGYILPALEDGTPVVLCIPACALNAPHRRDRFFLVAFRAANRKPETRQANRKAGNDSQSAGNSARQTPADTNSNGRRRGNSEDEKHFRKTRGHAFPNVKSARLTSADADINRFQGDSNSSILDTPGRQEQKGYSSQLACHYWAAWPVESPVCRRDDGIPGKLDGIGVSKWRKETIKAYGNAVVPQLVYVIFQAIQKAIDEISS